MVAGFIGMVIGYVSANARQIVGFHFGSSNGSEQKADGMAAAFKQTFGATSDGGQVSGVDYDWRLTSGERPRHVKSKSSPRP